MRCTGERPRTRSPLPLRSSYMLVQSRVSRWVSTASRSSGIEDSRGEDVQRWLCVRIETAPAGARPRNGALWLRFCVRQLPIEGQCVVIEIVESEFARSPRRVAKSIGGALDPALPVLAEERVWVRYQQPQADRAHLMFELKLHVQLDRIAPESDVVRRVDIVLEGEAEAKLVRVEINRLSDVAC